ncbi:MAG: hypothetical protein ABIJ81_04315 [Patescibacteria group bacterium]
MSFSQLEQAILRTTSFFDIFQYPLTSIECWRLMYDPKNKVGAAAFEQVEQALKQLVSKHVLINTLGFWQLKSSQSLFKVRQDRYRLASQKYRRLARWIKAFTLLSSVRFIAVVNSLGYRNPEKTDDIDLFIVTKQKKIWLTRWWLTGLAKLFGSRPTITHQQDGLCLSFYLSDNHLALNDLMIGDEDVYFHFWFTQMTVLFNDGVGRELIKANQNWLRYFPNLELSFMPVTPPINLVTRLVRIITSLFTWRLFNPLARLIQKQLLPSALRKSANQDTSVVLSEEVLKFHNQDRRAYYYGIWQAKLSSLGI